MLKLNLSLLLLTAFTKVLYGDPSYCFSYNTTFSDASNGHENVTTSEACQALCARSSDCTAFTWFDYMSTAYNNYCLLFSSPRHPSSCEHCTSGPRSCMCSGPYSCELGDNNLLELFFQINAEIDCAEQCFAEPECNYYSWYSKESSTLQLTCAFLRNCEGEV